MAAPEQRGRSADARAGKSRGHLSPGNTSSRRRSSDVQRDTNQGRKKYPVVIEQPTRDGASKPKSVLPEQAKTGVEPLKNMTRNDLRRAVTSAAGMMETDPEKSSVAADTILGALLWDSIKKLDRCDDDVVLAKEYLIICFFNTGDFAKAEDFSRQVLTARMAKRPPNAELVRGARQKLIQVLIKIGNKFRMNGKEQEAYQVMDEALDLAVMNMSTGNNPNSREDAKDVLSCSLELLNHRPNPPKERARLIRFKIMALQKTGNNESFDSLKRITLERHQLMRIYVLRLKDKAKGEKVYEETRRGIEAFRLSSYQAKDAISLAIETEAIWESLMGDAAEEETKSKQPASTSQEEDKGKSHHQKTTEKDARQIRQREATTEHENSYDPGVHQGAARTGTGLTEASETDRSLVLFDAAPTSKNDSSEKWVKDFIRFRNGILPGQFNDNTMKRIRLTVIDTGIDASHKFIEEHWSRYRSEANGAQLPLFKDFVGSLNSPTDEDGHGTFIAGLVLRLAPDVELSVARVCKNQTSMNEDGEREKKIAEAIYYAKQTWRTDIISISLGCDEEMNGHIRRAINEVRKSNVVILCAAGNHGITRESLPVPARLDGVFKIFACEPNGHASTMNPLPTSDGDYCFGTLGCNIQSTWPISLKRVGEKGGLEMIEDPKLELPGLWTVMSGTSFATPIAAALVAILYQFYDENKAIRFKKLPPSVAFKTPEAVKAILLRMSLFRGTDGHKTLVPTSGKHNHFKFYRGIGKSRVASFADALTLVLFQGL
ncbi:thermostable alkaline protease [Colletotrichum camelliae]|nr:thermostable alkaline protease [Colletotrichum camelliae]